MSEEKKESQDEVRWYDLFGYKTNEEFLIAIEDEIEKRSKMSQEVQEEESLKSPVYDPEEEEQYIDTKNKETLGTTEENPEKPPVSDKRSFRERFMERRKRVKLYNPRKPY